MWPRRLSNNVVKHAQGDRGRDYAVHAGRYGLPVDGGQRCRLHVREWSKPNTLGLTSMRERVEQIGGTFEIGPEPDRARELCELTSILSALALNQEASMANRNALNR